MSWVEARLHPGRKPSEVYQWLDGPARLVHHFWDEPWWPGAYVVRLLGTQADLGDCPAISHLALWDERGDESVYGETWAPWAFQFFEAGSILSMKDSDWERGKFIHCYLNAQGFDNRDEIRFALDYAWKRLTLPLRLWWRGGVYKERGKPWQRLFR